MSDESRAEPKVDSPFDKFDQLARKLVRVPKAEVDVKEAEYQKAKAKRRKRRKTN